MQLFDRLLGKKQEEKRMDSNIDIIPRDTNIRRFLSLKRYYRKKKNTTQIYTTQKQNQELLLTQCIETALYLPVTTSMPTGITSSEPVMQHRRTISFSEELTKQPRQRRLSLPSQLNNIGYLASIPEVDSQIALNNHD